MLNMMCGSSRMLKCIVMFLLIIPISSSARDWYVTPEGKSGHHGRHWEEAKSVAWFEKQDEARSGDRILLKGGTYSGNFKIKGGVHVIGLGSALNPVILKAGDPAKSVLTQSSTAFTPTTWEGITFQVGSNPIVLNGRITLKKCHIMGGEKFAGGETDFVKGYLRIRDEVKIIDCVISNHADADVAVFASGNTLIKNCAIIYNQNTGVFLEMEAHMVNSLIARNHSEKTGGVMAHSGRIDRCTIVCNAGGVGGISCTPNTEVTNSVIWGNRGNSFANYYITSSVNEVSGLNFIDVRDVEQRVMWGDIGQTYDRDGRADGTHIRYSYIENPDPDLKNNRNFALNAINENNEGPHFQDPENDNFTIKREEVSNHAGCHFSDLPPFKELLRFANNHGFGGHNGISACTYDMMLDPMPNPQRIRITAYNHTDTPCVITFGNMRKNRVNLSNPKFATNFFELDITLTRRRYEPWRSEFSQRYFNVNRYFLYNPDTNRMYTIPAKGKAIFFCNLTDFVYRPPNNAPAQQVDLSNFFQEGDMEGNLHLIIRNKLAPYMIKAQTFKINIDERSTTIFENML